MPSAVPLPQRFNKSILLTIGLISLLVIVAAVAFAQNEPQAVPFCQTQVQPFAYTLCQFEPSQQKATLSLVWLYPNTNTVLLNFANLLGMVGDNKTVQFAMNAGMYDQRYAPIGYTVLNGKLLHKLNQNAGGGNFHLMPNGVFWWDNKGYHVTETHAMAGLIAQGTKPLFATQSGPMLVIKGKIHPAFDPHSRSLKTRNGVGVCQDGKIKFVISDQPVSFYQFAELFKSSLGCEDALFLDGGRASALYSKELGRHDTQYMGAMLALTTP